MPLPGPTRRRTPLPKPRAAEAALARQVPRRTPAGTDAPSFALRLAAGAEPARGRPQVAVPLVAAAGVVVVLVGWLQGAWIASAAGALVAAGAAAAYGLKRRRGVDSIAPSTLDRDAAQRLDALIEACAGELPEPALGALRSIAAAVGRIAAQLAMGQPPPPWRPEDSLFAGELLRRYLPDAIEHFLRVPRADRASPILEDGRSPAEALVAQLQGLRDELGAAEGRLAKASAEQLALHGEFLEQRRRD